MPKNGLLNWDVLGEHSALLKELGVLDAKQQPSTIDSPTSSRDSSPSPPLVNQRSSYGARKQPSLERGDTKRNDFQAPESAGKIKESKNYVERLEDNNEILEEQNKKLRADNQNLSMELQKLLAENQNISQTLQGLQAGDAEAEKSTRLEGEHLEAPNELSQMRGELSQICNELSQIRNELSETQRRLTFHQEQFWEMSYRLQDYEMEVENLKKKLRKCIFVGGFNEIIQASVLETQPVREKMDRNKLIRELKLKLATLESQQMEAQLMGGMPRCGICIR